MTTQDSLRHDSPYIKTLPKEERLHHKKLIEGLFSKGSSFLVYPFKVLHQFAPEAGTENVQVLIVVPKRSFKKAHDRNRLKRQIKEAYRHQKHILQHLPAAEQVNLLGIIYVAKEKLPFSTIQKKLTSVLERCVGK